MIALPKQPAGNATVQLNFEWDPIKAAANQQKYGVRFEQVATIFRDRNMLSLYDEEHSNNEDRWITLGLSVNGPLLVVHHTFEETDDQTVMIRIFSSRRATPAEIARYTERAT